MIERVLPPKNNSSVDRISLYYDGVVFNTEPFPAAWSFLVRLNGETVYKESALIDPSLSPNDASAKMIGLFMALQWLTAQDRFSDNVVVMGDNMMIQGSMAGTRPPPGDKHWSLWTECRKLASPFFPIQFVWITKAENRDCRVLTFAAINETSVAV